MTRFPKHNHHRTHLAAKGLRQDLRQEVEYRSHEKDYGDGTNPDAAKTDQAHSKLVRTQPTAIYARQFEEIGRITHFPRVNATTGDDDA